MRFRLALLAVALTLSACFKPEIRQGNFLSDDKIALVKPGMTPAQVEFVLGPPMAKDPTVMNQWDYVRYVNPNNGQPEQVWHVIVSFKDGKVASVDQPEVKNKQQQLQLPSVKDASQLPPDQDNGSAGPNDSGTPPPI